MFCVRHSFVLHYIVSFLFCNHLEEEEGAGCFAFIVLRMSRYHNCSLLFLTVPWDGLQCVLVVFPDHTHLLLVTMSNFSLRYFDKESYKF